MTSDVEISIKCKNMENIKKFLITPRLYLIPIHKTLKSSQQHHLFINVTCEDKSLEFGSETLVTTTELLSDFKLILIHILSTMKKIVSLHFLIFYYL